MKLGSGCCAVGCVSQGRSSRGRRGGGGHVPCTFFDPPPIFPPTFSDLLLRCEWPNIQPITRQIISWARSAMSFKSPAALAARGFIHSLLCSLAVWGKMHPRKKQRTIMSFFFSNTHSKYVWCRDDTIHVIRFPCYDLTYCNQTSTVRPFKSHLRLKATTCESTMKKYLGAPVQLTRSAYLCLRWGSFKGLTYLLLQLSNVSQTDVSSHYNKQSVDRV